MEIETAIALRIFLVETHGADMPPRIRALYDECQRIINGFGLKYLQDHGYVPTNK